MNPLKTIVAIFTRREYLGFLVCWFLWMGAALFPEVVRLNWVIVLQFLFVWAMFSLIRKYGN